jgi:hypothetical protein
MVDLEDVMSGNSLLTLRTYVRCGRAWRAVDSRPGPRALWRGSCLA